jgi:hypothetical protein
VADDGWDEQVGSVAEEAQRLLESLRRAGGGDEPGAAEGDERPDAAGDDEPRPAPADEEPWTCTDPFCRSCPLCRTVAVVRGLSPETLRRLADLATVAAGVLSELAGERARRSTEAAQEPGDDGGPPSRSRPAPVRPIPVRDADEDAPRG